MTKLWLDFETYSEVDIKESGLYKYTSHGSFHPWCAFYAIDDEPVEGWIATGGSPHSVLQDALCDHEVKIYAHNAEFEWQTIENTPSLPDNIPLNKFVDTMALAGTFGYPLSLDKFVKAIGLPYGKTAGSTRLTNKLCTPQKKTAFNPEGKWNPKTAPKDFDELYEYCRNDVEIMRKAVKRLPKQELLPMEQFIWQHVALQNFRGMPIDYMTVYSIYLMLGEFKINQERQLSRLTDKVVTGGKQVARLKNWLAENGANMANLQVATVERWLKKDIPSHCKEALQLRQDLANSSTSKFERMLSMLNDDSTVKGNAVYFGAHTGRNAGRGIQIHNLPRAAHDDPEKVIQLFNSRELPKIERLFPNINDTAKKLVRPMICAPEGKTLVVVDYSSIENVVLHWCANDTVTTEEFRQGLDQYVTYASARFKVPYDEVTKEQRNYAKPCVLGLGYGGGAAALMRVAAGYGITLTEKEANEDKNFYRKKYKKVPELWNKVFTKAYEAIATGDSQYLMTGTTTLEFRSAGGYLFILLPSGRRLSYPMVRLNLEWSIQVNGKEVPMFSKISYMGIVKKTFCRVGTHPGLLVENIIQAMARDILMYGLLCAEQGGFKIIGSVHDEGIALMDEEDADVEDMVTYMCRLQDWSRNIPVKAVGYKAKRYRKE